MKRTREAPPSPASRMLKLISEYDDHFTVDGDFDEEHHDIVRERGTASARLWYWNQFVRSLPYIIKNRIYWEFVMLKNYVKITLRHLGRYKAYSFINISGLAIGMACCMLILLWVQDELSYDKFHEKADDIYRLTTATPNSVWASSPWALMPTLKQNFPEIIKGTWYGETIRPVKYHGKAINEQCVLMSPDFFEMFSFSFIR